MYHESARQTMLTWVSKKRFGINTLFPTKNSQYSRVLYDPITVTEHWTASNRGPLGKPVHTLLQALVSDQVGPAEQYDTHAPLHVTRKVVMRVRITLFQVWSHLTSWSPLFLMSVKYLWFRTFVSG